MTVVDRIRGLQRAGSKVAIVALDIAGAFPNVDREILLQEFEQQGYEQQLVSWERSFLSERTLNIVVDGLRQSSDLPS